MKTKRTLLFVSVITAFLIAFTISFKGGGRDAHAGNDIDFQKIIAKPGVLDTSLPGIELWHDYGSYALYKVSGEALKHLRSTSDVQLQVDDEMDRLFLREDGFDTQSGDPVDIPANLEVSGYEGHGLYLVQFVGPIKEEWLESVRSTGAKLVHYIANNGYLVWADDASLDKLLVNSQAGEFQQYTGVYQPYYKVGPTLSDRTISLADPDEIVHVVVQVYDHPGKINSQGQIEQLSLGQIVTWYPILSYQNAEFAVRVGDIPMIANLPDVVWVGERLERQRNDEVQGQIIAGNFDGSMAGPSGPGYLSWLDSYGFSEDPADYPVVDITDDGIGNGSVNSGDYTLHEFGSLTNPTRLDYVANCTNSSSGRGLDGHGHINVSIAGGYDVTSGTPYQDGDGFNRGMGINPYGRFAGTRVFNDSGSWSTSKCGNSDPGLIESIQDNGAAISSNSWGCSDGDCWDTYNEISQAFDVGVRDADLSESGNQELIFIFSAGNGGSSSGTIDSPGNGKNTITVGASENDRPTWTDGCGVTSSGANDAMDIINFSGRGPVPGGRVKPELVAPGTHIQGTASTSSSYTGYGVCDKYQPSGQTIFAASSGTSHSTPAIAGAASLYYYWLENVYGITPTPALMKAYLIAHPTYLTGNDANDTLPSNDQGYGMPNLALAFDDTPRIMVNQEVVFDNSGETWVYSGVVADETKPVRIVMAYTDKAGAIGTSPEVNDLDLSGVIGGTSFKGNHFSGQWSTTGGSADRDNNYEAIFLPPGTTGSISLTVTGFNIADNGVPNTGDSTDQDFALVCYNCIDEYDFTLDASPDIRAICTPDDGIYEITVGQIGEFDDPVTFSATGHPSGTTTNFNPNPVIPPGINTLTISNTGNASTGFYNINVVGITPTRTHTVTVGLDIYDGLPAEVSLQSPQDEALEQALTPTLSWGVVGQTISYTLEMASDLGFGNLIYSTTITSTSHKIETSLDSNQWVYWRVTAVNACGPGSSSDIYAFKTMDIPPVLLVDDDDNDPNVSAYYTETLDALGIAFDYWDTVNSDDEPTSGELSPYDTVIWFTGDETGGSAGPGSSGESALGSWLDSGGKCMFISSQDYYNDRGLTTFMQNYLGVSSITERHNAFQRYASVSGIGSVFGDLGESDLSYPFSSERPDEVEPDSTSEGSFLGIRRWTDVIAGINRSTANYKTTYLGFPFEALPDSDTRQETMNTFLTWCSPHQVFLPLIIK